MMENPEEVLQALDEFQKMRPSEIPKELEEYLCFVAKTGDPVYQWGLIKALFREKLMRVMTEFYESCPTPDITACPNVEAFNYDIMKKNLLDRMESFASAPFTVQRICELLTAPRKEYNRIDKFMRAIEKNILVVSTKDPGPLGRRSENGDGMVNGSLEDDASHHALIPSNKLEEVDTWEKTCAETTAVLLQMEDSEELNLERTTNALLKNSFGKSESITAADGTSSTFITSTGDFSASTAQLPVSEITAVVQNLTAADVADAIMNEDTSSQPSLELESDDSNSNDAKKLQTTFQAKDFSLDETESSNKTFTEDDQGARSEETLESVDAKLDVTDEQSVQSYSSEELSNDSASDSQNSLPDKVDESVVTETENESDKKLEPQAVVETGESTSETNLESSQTATNNVLEEQKDLVTDDVSKPSDDSKVNSEVAEEESKVEQTELTAVTEIASVSTESSEKPKEACEVTKTEDVSEVIKPVSEESSHESIEVTETTKEPEVSKLTIEEAAEGDSKTSTTVTDPLPVVEEPKESETTSAVIVPVVEPFSAVTEVKNGLDNAPEKLDQVEDNQMLVTNCDETAPSKGVTEWMDVDNEASQPSAQDEPMEQEIVEALNS